MHSLTTRELSLSYGQEVIIDNMSVSIPKGEITVFIGPNGCGKSTLLRSLARLLKPKQGSVILNGQNIAQKRTKDIAQELAILPQSPIVPEGLTVYELVKQGRYPYRKMLKQWSKDDEAKVQKALADTNMTALKDQAVDSLSGGQRQRAWIALTLAQDTEILLLDEPTTYLDMAHQIEILDLLYDLNKDHNRTIVMVLHDLNLASRYADHLVAIKDKKIFSQGAPEDTISCEMIHDVFKMRCSIACDPIFGTPMCIPHGKGNSLGLRNKLKINQ